MMDNNNGIPSIGDQKHPAFVSPENQYTYMMHGIFPVPNFYPHTNGFFPEVGYGNMPEKRKTSFNCGTPFQTKRFKEPQDNQMAYQMACQNTIIASCSKENNESGGILQTVSFESENNNVPDVISDSVPCPQELVGGASESLEEVERVCYKDVPNICWTKLQPSTYEITSPSNIKKYKSEVIQKSSISPLDVFLAMFSDDIMDQIIDETNINGGDNAERYRDNGNNPKLSTKYQRSKAWKPIQRAELLTYIAINLYMNIKPLRTLKQYWESGIWGDSVIPKYMTRDRYLEINRTVHFATVTLDDTNLEFNMKKMETLLGTIQDNFKRFYYPGENLSLDEHVIDWKYPWTSKRCGLRLYALCDSCTSYCLHFNIVLDGVGMESSLGNCLPSVLTSDKVICTLIEPYANKGHTLYLGNYCCSPFLGLFLKNHAKTDVVGMFRQNDKQLPKDFSKHSIKNGESSDYLGEMINPNRFNGRLLLQKWRINEEENIHIMSTKHDNRLVKIQPPQEKKSIKPLSIAAFDEHTIGIEKVHQSIDPFVMERTRGMKWPIKFFKRLINYVLHNAFIVYKNQDSSTTKLEFRKSVAEEILNMNDIRDRENKNNTSDRNNTINGRTPGLTHIMKSTGKKKCCWYCPRFRNVKDRRTVWVCTDCNNKQLCKSPCFQEFHEKLFNGEFHNQ